MSSIVSPAAWARRSAANPWRVVAIWGVALVASLAIIATLLSSALTSSTNFIGSTESKRADHQITHQIGIHDAVTETVVIHKAGATPGELRPTVERLAQQIRGLGSGIVGGATTPWSGGAGKGLIDRSGSSALIAVRMAGTESDAQDHIAKVLALAQSAGESSGFTVRVTGQASIAHDVNKVAESDLAKGEAIGIPVALIVLLLVFGTLVSALLPHRARDRLDHRLARADRAHRPGLRAVVLRDEHDHDDGPRGRHRLRAVHRLPLPRGADGRLREARRDRARRLDREPRRAVLAASPSSSRWSAADRADDDLPEPRHRRDPGGAVRARSRADAAAGDASACSATGSTRVASSPARPGAPARARPRRSASGRAQSPASCGGRSSASSWSAGALIVAAIPYFDPEHGRRRRHEPALDAAVQAGLRDAASATSRSAAIAPARIPVLGDPDSSANRAEIARIAKAVAGEPSFGTPSLEPGASARGAPRRPDQRRRQQRGRDAGRARPA